MEILLAFLKVFLVGGLICVIGQILIDKTKLTTARILVIFLLAGIFLTAIGLYDPLVEWAGSGATVPISGFGYCLANGVAQEIDKVGALGILTGGLKATAAGITSAVVFGYLVALFAKPDIK